MKKWTLKSLRTDRRSRWGATAIAVALAGSGSLACAQTVLRFVGPNDAPASATTTLPQPTIAAAPAAPPSESEFRFVEMTEGKVAPLPQFSVSSRAVSGGGQSTLKFAPAMPSQPPVAIVEPRDADSFELRFRSSSVPATVVTAPPVAPVTAPPVAPIARPDSSTQQLATELFAKPPLSQANTFQPRIAMVVEHIPAPAPQHVDAQPVRSARETAPANAAVPLGSELFASSAPTVATSAPRHWDLPAMDYGSALRQVQPAQPPTMSAKPIAPQRVVARELPSSATNMFGLGAPEPLLVQAPVERPQPAPALPKPQAQVIVQQPVTTTASPTLAVPPREIVAAAPVAKPAVTAAKVAPVPTPAPVPAEPVVVATRKLPAAAELDFATSPVTPEPTTPHFVAAEPARVASIAPTPAALVQQKLVPASVATPTQTNSQFAYQQEQLANKSHVAEYKAASIPPQPVVDVPERSRVVATADPHDPNTYSFSFATTQGQPPAMYVNDVGPEAVGNATPESMPNAMSAPCACNGYSYGQGGCPYLPGQSGTRALCGVDCGRCGSSCCSSWSDATCIPWALLGPGEYVGPARPAHVETYYLRVNDVLTLTFIESRKKSAEHYRIGVGDELQIEWLQGASSTEKALDRSLLVQPDGTVTLPLVGEVNAAGKTVNDFRDEVVKLYSKYQRDPQITVTPLTVNVAVQDVLKAVTSKNASSGQTQDVRVTPEGTIQAAGIGSVYVQGLTLDELRSELEARYSEAFGPGLAVSPQLTERATSYVFLGGEVRAPGRYQLEGPTTVMQAVAMAGGWNNGGNLRQVVVFRRDENWCLKATKIDIRAPYYGKDPCPTNDIWLRDNDLVVVPKSCVLCTTDLIELYFTRGIYSVFPITYVYDFTQNSGLVPVP